MNRKPLNAVGLLAVSLLLGAASASAQSSFTLTPPPLDSGIGGASRLGISTTKPSGVLTEEQYIEVYVDANTLLTSSNEHIAISTFANGQPVDQYGSYLPDAPNGGIGIALGTLDNGSHQSCPVDPFNTKIEFAIEQFAWRNIFGSKILNCVSFDKSALNGVSMLRIAVSVQCTGTTCNAAASVVSASTFTLLGSVSNSGIPLANPTTIRNSWYAVTNFASGRAPHSATFWVNNDRYWLIY